METFPDEVLVEYARQGRCDAQAILLRRHEDAVYNIVHNMCGASSEAEELIYQPVISPWRESGSPGPNSPFRTWILGNPIQTPLPAPPPGTPPPAFDRTNPPGLLPPAPDPPPHPS